MEDVLEYLKDHCKSEDNAVSAGDLGALFNLSKRGVRAVVTQLRKECNPICSSNYGYWYSDDVADIVKTIGRLEAQVLNMQSAVEGLRNAINRR